MKTCIHEFIRAILVAMALLLAAAWAGAAPVPVTQLPLPDGYGESVGQAVNNAGQVAGYCETTDGYWRACLWDGGACTIIDVADGVLDDLYESEAKGINASGQIIGSGYDANNEILGFIWQNGVMTALEIPGFDFCDPMAINDAGQVVGYCYNAPEYEWHGFIWQNGVVTMLVWSGVDRDGNSAQFPIDPDDINAAGQVVGTVEDPLDLLDYEPAVLWEAGAVTVLTPGETAYLCQINNNGWVAGERAADENIWLYVPGAGLRILDVSGLYPAGDPLRTIIAYPQGLNDANQVLIRALNTASQERLWVWEDDGTAVGAFTEVPLSSLLASGGSVAWIQASLNNAGQVAGSFYVQGQYRTEGFFWDSATPGAIAALAKPLGHNSCDVKALNDAGLAAGATGGTYHACTWNAAATPVNQAPVANAGPDQTVTTFAASTAVQLDGTGSGDPDGDVCQYAWSENGTPLATGTRPTLTLARGAHTLTLTVTDSYGASSSDTVTITVARPPSALTVTVTSVARKGKSVVVMAEISNTQATAATDVTVTEATLGGVNTVSRLPLSVRTVRANSSKSCTVKFTSAAIPAGTVTFWVYGTSSMGNFYAEVPVTVP
ncbi:MAG: PKD domain-containing protein [Armatimonadota bacterium]